MSTSTTGHTITSVSTTSIKALPVNLFASVMGLSGLSLAWGLAHRALGAPAVIGEVIGMIAIVVFIALGLGYLTKAIKFPSVVRAEFSHPIIGNFFGTITIAILLISSVVGTYSAVLQQWIWTAGVVSTLTLGAAVVARLLNGNVKATDVVPAWLIAGVASLDIAVTGGSMPMSWASEINLFAAAIGSVIAVVFFVMIFSRLVHGDPMPKGMLPSLTILIAPFEVGFLAYANLMHGVDMFSGVLFYFGLFIFLVVAVKLYRASVPFSAGWWAIGFPIAALGNAAFLYADKAKSVPLLIIAVVILAFLSAAIAVMLVRTLHLLFSGRLLAV